MSVEAITWALRQPVKHSSAKFVLVVLGNCANAEHAHAWPSLAYMCAATGQDRKTIIANIQRLLEWGLIEDTGKRVGDTKQIVVYKLNCTGDLFAAGVEKRNGSENGTVPFSPGKGTEIPVKGTENGTRNRQEPKGTVNTAQRFEDWWVEYPKQVSRKRCLGVWEAKGLDARADDLIADVQRRIKHCHRWSTGFAPDPLTYLEDERWTDQIHPKPGNEPAPDVPRGTSSTNVKRDVLANPEDELTLAVNFIRHQHKCGAYGEGAEADATRDRLLAEARAKHPQRSEQEQPA